MGALTPFEREDEDRYTKDLVKATIICETGKNKIERKVEFRKKEDFLNEIVEKDRPIGIITSDLKIVEGEFNSIEECDGEFAIYIGHEYCLAVNYDNIVAYYYVA